MHSPSVQPNLQSANPAGLAGLPVGEELSSPEKQQLAELAEQVLKDPILCEQVTQRVYELLLDDLRIQKERSRNYGRRI
ncbi:MAG: hypothetical protein F6K03_04025 [Kamptonema sp. SIO4C4]|nr:hypothetical protein [Kamptonema sp. SIO4C4]